MEPQIKTEERKITREEAISILTERIPQLFKKTAEGLKLLNVWLPHSLQGSYEYKGQARDEKTDLRWRLQVSIDDIPCGWLNLTIAYPGAELKYRESSLCSLPPEIKPNRLHSLFDDELLTEGTVQKVWERVHSIITFCLRRDIDSGLCKELYKPREQVKTLTQTLTKARDVLLRSKSFTKSPTLKALREEIERVLAETAETE